MTEIKIRSQCDRYEELMKIIEREIANKNRRIDYLQSEIERLTSEAHPDTNRIETLRESKKKLEEELIDDRDQLRGLEDEYQFNCRS